MRSLSPYRPNRSLFSWDGFDDIFNEFERSLGSFPAAQSRDFRPALDVEEKEGVYLITMDIPGVKRDDIQINVSDRTLTVSGERVKEARGQGHYFERSYGRFARSLTLPENVQAEAIEAHYDDGELRIVLPKSEEERSKTIKVQSGKSGGLLEKFFSSNKEKDVKSTGETSSH